VARACAQCGEEKEASGGKLCENGHFVRGECIWKGTGGGLLVGAETLSALSEAAEVEGEGRSLPQIRSWRMQSPGLEICAPEWAGGGYR